MEATAAVVPGRRVADEGGAVGGPGAGAAERPQAQAAKAAMVALAALATATVVAPRALGPVVADVGGLRTRTQIVARQRVGPAAIPRSWIHLARR